MTTIYDILRRPVITEKSNFQNNVLNQVVFEVSPEANKTMIKEAVETLFNVTVERVNIIIVPAKRSRRWQSRRVLVRKPGYKKAIVQLAPGDSIDVFEGVR
jgi:large subunit ribosomal protein L23